MSESMTEREAHLNKVASQNFAFAVDVLSQLQSLDAGVSLLQIAIREGDPHKELLVRASDLLKEVKQLRASYPALGPDSPPSWREEYIAQ